MSVEFCVNNFLLYNTLKILLYRLLSHNGPGKKSAIFLNFVSLYVMCLPLVIFNTFSLSLVLCNLTMMYLAEIYFKIYCV